MHTVCYTKRHLLLATILGALISYGVFTLTMGNLDPSKPDTVNLQPSPAANVAIAKAPDIEQIRKDLSTRFIGDPRTFGEKLRDFVAENSHPHTIAIACKVVSDLAENPETLTNQEMVSLYDSQTNKEFKRVLAQVLSLRGDNSLMQKLVSEAESALKNQDPSERRKVLLDLAKTHYAGAANAVVTSLHDSDTSVKLDALLALRGTGNESHIRHLEKLINDADESVRWLANDAINHLQNLSSKARTKLTTADIVSELPLIPAN